MSKKRYLSGGKYCRRHGSTTEFGYEVALVLENDERVKKIRLGFIEGTAHAGGKRRIKCKVIDAGLELYIRDIGTVQTLYIYTAESAAVKAFIEERWGNGK